MERDMVMVGLARADWAQDVLAPAPGYTESVFVSVVTLRVSGLSMSRNKQCLLSTSDLWFVSMSNTANTSNISVDTGKITQPHLVPQHLRGYQYQCYTVTECLVDVYLYSFGFINDVFNWIVMDGVEIYPHLLVVGWARCKVSINSSNI